MKTTLSLKDMRFHAYHGCYPFERENGGEYSVDFSCEVECRSDSLEDTVNLEDVYRITSEQMGKPCNLIETVAGNIALALQRGIPALGHFSVRVAKFNPPLSGHASESSVTVEV